MTDDALYKRPTASKWPSSNVLRGTPGGLKSHQACARAHSQPSGMCLSSGVAGQHDMGRYIAHPIHERA